MSKSPSISTEPGTLAVLHLTNAVWRGLIVGTRGLKLSVIASQEFSADQAGRIDAWLTENRVAEVLCVLPAAAVIARNCTLPNAPPEQLQQALALQAEAHLLGMAPQHRLGMAVLPNSNGETSRSGIILAWPESARVDVPPISRPVQYVPDIAALAALLNGSRPAEPLVWLDRADGSIALAMTHTGGAVFRGTREDAETSETWQKSVARVMAETGLSVGHTGAYVENLAQGARRMAASLGPNQSSLFLPRDILGSVGLRIQGAGDSGWWSRFGIALGAVLARSGPLSPLTHFLFTPPMERPSPVKAMLASLSQPRTAMRLVIAAILLLAFGPIIVHGVRWGILRVRFGNLQDQVKAVNEYRHQLSIYNTMRDQKVWPMTKLLADIATNIPEGIDLDSMRVERGSEFAVQGTARDNAGKKATELVAQMQADLHSTGIFNDVVYDWGEGNSMGVYKFNLSGKVANAYKQKDYDPAHDFGLWTLQSRQAGDPMPGKDALAKSGGDAGKPGPTAAPPVQPVPNPTAQASSGSRTPSAETPGAGQPVLAADTGKPSISGGPDADTGSADGRDRDSRSRRTSGSGSQVPFGETDTDHGASGDATLPPSRDIPEAVTQDQIDKMTLAEAQAHLTKVSVARRHAQADAEVKARLKKEFELLLAHINKLKNP